MSAQTKNSVGMVILIGRALEAGEISVRSLSTPAEFSEQATAAGYPATVDGQMVSGHVYGLPWKIIVRTIV